MADPAIGTEPSADVMAALRDFYNDDEGVRMWVAAWLTWDNVEREYMEQNVHALATAMRALRVQQMHPAPPVGGSGQACGKCHDHAD